MASLLLSTLIAGLASATLGIDYSQPCSVANLQCLKGKGFTFAVVRVHQSTGRVDPNGKAMIQAAHSAGMTNVDGYIFPCPKCGNAAGQITDTINALSGAPYGMLWLDIEGTQYWTDQTSNRKFFEQLVSAAESHGVKLGVYSSASQWNPIFGAGYTAGSHLPLWYAHYDGKPSFSDFTTFGGWTKPAIKQYQGDQTVCGCGIDENFY